MSNGVAGPPIALWSAGPKGGDREDLSDINLVAVLSQAVDLTNFHRVTAVRAKVHEG